MEKLLVIAIFIYPWEHTKTHYAEYYARKVWEKLWYKEKAIEEPMIIYAKLKPKKIMQGMINKNNNKNVKRVGETKEVLDRKVLKWIKWKAKI